MCQVVGERLGCGSFGQVAQCRDRVTGQLVAVKILRNRKPFYNQGLVEVRTLQYLNSRDPEGHSHTVRMILSFVHRQHLCIVFELLGMNLYDILRRTSFVGLSLGLVRRFAHQIVHALYFLSQVGVIHCDLKLSPGKKDNCLFFILKEKKIGCVLPFVSLLHLFFSFLFCFSLKMCCCVKIRRV